MRFRIKKASLDHNEQKRTLLQICANRATFDISVINCSTNFLYKIFIKMISINNIHHFDAEIASAGDKLVIVDFGANWCGPCKLIAPHFERLANEYSDTARFLKVDVDECEDVALIQGVSALPTFVFFKNKEVVDRIQGSHPVELEEKVKSYVNVREENDEEVKSEVSDEVPHVCSHASTTSVEERQASTEKERKSVDRNTHASSTETRACCFKFKKHSH